MARKPKPRPSFFKILINKGFTRQLELPPAFVTKYGGMLPANMKLRSSSGIMGHVKLEQTDDRKFGFTKGWTKFVKDLRLIDGELLVFWFDSDQSMFDVSVFGINGCEKELLGLDSNVELEYDDDDLMSIDQDASKKQSATATATCTVKKESASTRRRTRFHNSCPRFDIVLKKHQRYCVSLPKDFAGPADLIGKRTAVLEYQPKQQYWGVMLQDRSRPYHRLDMTVGWSNFLKENGLLFGKTYSLTFNRAKKVIEVKPVKRNK